MAVSSTLTMLDDPSMDLSDRIVLENYSFASGGQAEVFKGRLSDVSGLVDVAIKIFRIHGRADDPKAIKDTERRLSREVDVWRKLEHRNVLELLGIYKGGRTPYFPALVSPFCDGGDADYYLRNHPGANREKIILGVTRGLKYLHDHDIVHGDIKCKNIIINSDVPRLCDFGLSRIFGKRGFTATILRGTDNFMAPELYPTGDDNEDEDEGKLRPPPVTPATDMFAYGLTALQILTGKEIRRRPYAFAREDLHKSLPSRLKYDPQHWIPQDWWSLLESCWNIDAKSRLAVGDVLLAIESMTRKLEELPIPDLTGKVQQTVVDAMAIGTFSHIFRGTMRVNGVLIAVAIKMFIGVHTDAEQLEAMTRRLKREGQVWHQLEHPNIQPFYGLCNDLGPSPALISPFWDSGNVTDYLVRNPNAIRMDIVIGVAKGLQYLHSKDVIHGDMKGENVLIADDGTPRLSDFGRSKVVDRRGYTTAFAGTLRFMAPELFPADDDASDGVLTKATDVYGFAMLMLQLITGKAPYYYVKTDFGILLLLNKGRTPNRYTYTDPPVSDEVWNIMESAWAHDIQTRLTIDQVLSLLSGLTE